MEDHAHSPTVFFHALGLGEFNGILNNMKLKTASSIKQELGHAEVDDFLINLTPLSLASYRWTLCKQCRPR